MTQLIIFILSVLLWLTPVSTQQQHQQVDLSEYLCLFVTIHHESRSESTVGRQWVAAVVLNRARTTGKSICYTVNKPWQFTDINKTFRKLSKTSYKQLYDETNGKVAEVAYSSLYSDLSLPRHALYYHTKAVSPSWKNKLKKLRVIGAHIFYGIP